MFGPKVLIAVGLVVFFACGALSWSWMVGTGGLPDDYLGDRRFNPLHAIPDAVAYLRETSA
jgi:hypothetical protein